MSEFIQLPTNFEDDELALSMNGRREYNIKRGNQVQPVISGIYLEDVSTYEKVGSEFKSEHINAQNAEINKLQGCLMASDLDFHFTKNPEGDDYGYLNAQGQFVPFKTTHTETKSITANGTTDMGVDHKYRYVSVNVQPHAKYLGAFSNDTTINVSALGATATSQFLIVPYADQYAESTNYDFTDINRIGGRAYFYAARLSLNGGILTVTGPYVRLTVGINRSVEGFLEAIQKLSYQVWYINYSE